MSKIKIPQADFELAKKLKEAGFDVPTFAYYYDGDTGGNVLRCEFSPTPRNMNTEELCYSAPDLFTVCEWLREVHLMHVINNPATSLEDEGISIIWMSVIYTFHKDMGPQPHILRDQNKSILHWAERNAALIAAINHCLISIKKEP